MRVELCNQNSLIDRLKIPVMSEISAKVRLFQWQSCAENEVSARRSWLLATAATTLFYKYLVHDKLIC